MRCRCYSIGSDQYSQQYSWSTRDARYASVSGLASVSQSGMCQFKKTNTRGMGTSTGVDNELAIEVVPSIDLTTHPQHIAARAFGHSGDSIWDLKIPARKQQQAT